MFVYILKSKFDGAYYVGMTSNLLDRLKYHNSGKVRSTKSRIPWEIVYYEETESLGAARVREKYLKSAAGRRFRKEILGD